MFTSYHRGPHPLALIPHVPAKWATISAKLKYSLVLKALRGALAESFIETFDMQCILWIAIHQLRVNINLLNTNQAPCQTALWS